MTLCTYFTDIVNVESDQWVTIDESLLSLNPLTQSSLIFRALAILLANVLVNLLCDNMTLGHACIVNTDSYKSQLHARDTTMSSMRTVCPTAYLWAKLSGDAIKISKLLKMNISTDSCHSKCNFIHCQKITDTTSLKTKHKSHFYSASALLPMQSAVLARPFLSVCSSQPASSLWPQSLVLRPWPSKMVRVGQAPTQCLQDGADLVRLSVLSQSTKTGRPYPGNRRDRRETDWRCPRPHAW